MPYDELDGVKRSVRMREVISARQLSASSSMLDKLNCTAAGRQVNDTSLTSASVPPAQEFNSHLIEFLFKSIWEYFSKTEYSTVIDLIMKVGELKQFPIVVCHGIGDGQVPIPTAEQIFTLEHAGIKYHLFENAYHVPHDVAKEFFKLLQEELCSPNVSKTLATSSVF